jgi:peptidoglycan/xylan/chitin deacetylase (PgdA/CDA1 family)
MSAPAGGVVAVAGGVVAAAGGLLALALLAPLPAGGAAPRPKVALTDRTLWPRSLASDRDFDAASRAEIALFVAALAEDDRAAAKAPAPPSGGEVKGWKRLTREQLVASFAGACGGCAAGGDHLLCPAAPPRDWEGLVAFVAGALAKLPPDLGAWQAAAFAFHQAYLREQLRLARLFPGITSEILPLDSSEILGDGLPEKTFLLTFDDGPTPVGGTTDQTLALVRAHGVNAAFFLLGTAVAPRRAQTSDAAMRDLYAGMCIGSHGQQHRSHVHWPEATSALAAFDGQLATLLPAGQPRLLFFRPPYGERSPEVLRALAGAGLTDLLWNIDSQDWQAAVTPELAAGRVLTLMLLKRRGIVLFHDVHAKALGALPRIWQALAGSGVHWLDCRTLGAPPAQ